MRRRWTLNWLKAGAFMTVFLAAEVMAQPGKAPVAGMATEKAAATETNSVDSPKSSASAQKPPSPEQAPTAGNPAVMAVLKLVDAGISENVIKAYLEAAPRFPQPTAADIIALKEHGISDEITVVLVKRSKEDAAAASEATAVARADRIDRSNNGLDPESYDYFQYYYLYPRTLSSAYDRLAPYPGPYFYGGFGTYFPRYGRFGFHRGIGRYMR